MASNSKILAYLLATILSFSLCNGRSFTDKKSTRPLSSRPSFSTLHSTIPDGSTSTSTARLLHRRNSSTFTSIHNRGGGSSTIIVYDQVDWTALVKYAVGIAVQMSFLFGFFTGVDKILAHHYFSSSPISRVPFALNVAFLYAFNLITSLFSILPSSNNERRKPTKERNQEYHKRNIPSWTPPGIAFVFGWPLLTFGIRAITGAMIVQEVDGRYASPAIMSLMFHLCIGDLWNTVNNVERRLGVSVVLLFGLWLTKAFAAVQFYKVRPQAGKLLAVTLTWITAAVALQTRTWQINPDSNTGKREPLVPMQHPKWNTKFRWEK